MAGKGPPPKPKALRQRTNKKVGHCDLEVGAYRKGRIPELFERACPCGGALEKPLPSAKPRRGRPRKARAACASCFGTGILPWHPLTLAWWRDVWTAEVAANYLRVDRHGLFRLAILVDKFWCNSSAGLGVRELSAEIRLQQQAYGNTPLDRSRLQWEVEHPGGKPEEGKGRVDEEPPPVLDSRAVLRALK